MTRLPFSVFAAAALTAGSFLLPATVTYAAPVSLDLTTGASNKLDLGFFAAGTTITLSFAGNGDLVDARYQTRTERCASTTQEIILHHKGKPGQESEKPS